MAQDPYEHFLQEYYRGNLSRQDSGQDCNPQMVDPNEIYGARYNDSTSEEDFWNHHGNTKDDYLALAEKIPDVQSQLQSGQSLDEIKQDPELRPCADAYFTPDRMVKVYEYDGQYMFQDDGRHRVAAAQELGVEMPVNVKGEYVDVSQQQGAGQDFDFLAEKAERDQGAAAPDYSSAFTQQSEHGQGR